MLKNSIGIIKQGEVNSITWVLYTDGLLTISGSGNFSEYNTTLGRGDTPWYQYRGEIKSARVNVKDMTNASRMFYACTLLKSIDLSDLDTSNITDMSEMFSGCMALESLDLRNFNTSNATNMYDMFGGCWELTSLDVSGFDTSNVMNMSQMFRDCRKLKSLNLSNFNTGNVIDMDRMFGLDTGMEVINLGSFDMSNVTRAEGMFDQCSSLQKIYTPINVRKYITLPNTQLVRGDGLEVKALPQNLSTSLELGRGYTPEKPDIINGTCGKDGNNIKFVLDNTKGSLEISGDGFMRDYNSTDTAPWIWVGNSVQLSIGNGIKSIGNYAFAREGGWVELEGELVIPPSVEGIGMYAFAGCTGLTGDLIIPKGVKNIGMDAFRNCTGIKDIYMDDGGGQLERIIGNPFQTNEDKNLNVLFHCVKDSYEYKWAKGKGFEVVELKDINSTDVECPDIALDETGAVQKPDLNISDGGKTLVKDTDYTLEYPDNSGDAYKAAGVYKIIVKGKRNYTGSREVQFTIRHVHSYGSTYNKDGAGHWQACACGELTAKAAHTYGEWTVTKEATETESGLKERACTVCGYKDTEVIPANSTGGGDKSISSTDVACPDIELDETGAVQKPDLNISDGGKTLVKDTDYTLEYPDNSGDAYKAAGVYKIIVKGKGNYTGSREVQFTIRHVHSYGSGYIKDGAEHWQACVCGEMTAKAAHTYDAWTVTKEATETESGLKERACTVCGYNDTEVIPAKSTGGGDSIAWGDILVPDRPANGQIPNGLWIANIDSAGYTYTGEAIMPQARVYDGNVLLTEKTDYAISIKNNVNVNDAKGVPTITVTGKGSYSGQETETFKINPVNIGDCYAEELYVKIGTNAQKPVPVIYYRGNKLKAGKDFTLTYSNTSGVYSQKGDYTVSAHGDGNYTGEKTITINAVEKIAKKPAASITKAVPDGFATSLTYTGSALKQEQCKLKIKDGNIEKELIEGDHYTVSYANNIKAGTATVTYYGKNGYSGKLKKTYKIVPFDIEKNEGGKASYDKTLECFFAKGGAKPKPAITFDGKALEEGTDYTLSYKNNAAVNTNASGSQAPCVIITGKGNFKGKISVNFTIKPQDLSNVKLAPCDKTYKKRAGIYKITPKLVDLDGKALSAGKDFDKSSITYAYEEAVSLENGGTKNAGDKVENADIIPAGTKIRITLTARTGGNYTNKFTGVYRIIKTDIKSAKVAFKKQYAYTGQVIEIKPEDITVTLAGKTLAPGEFTIDPATNNNMAKGKASITIKGTGGDYGGSKTVAFTIAPRALSW